MSVPVQTPYKKYTAAPGATVFPTTFRVVLAGDLQVRVDGVVATSGFTLSTLGAPSGLDVTFTAPKVGGEIVELQRIIPKSRVNDYQQLGDFNAATVNADIDRTWMSIQELGEEADRSVKVPIGSTIDPDQLISDLLATQAAAEAAAADAAAAKLAAQASAAAAAASAASTGLPSLTGKALNLLRVKADETGYETRTPAEVLTDIGASAASAVHGQCELTLVGGSLKLSPLNGNRITVNGVSCTVPDAGVTLAATGLLATTLYRIYAVATSGVITSLEASTTAQSTDTAAGNKGVKIKTGDSTRSFVGWAYCETAATFINTAARRGVRSAFNDSGVTIAGALVSVTTASNTYLEISSGGRAGCIVKAGESIYATGSATGYTTSTNNSAYAGVGLDGATTAAGDYALADIANSFVGMSVAAVFEPAEGWHYVTPTMRTTGGFNGFVQSAIRGRVGK